MEITSTYSDFISLNTNFKDVFSLDSDIDKENLWKRFIYTNNFKELLDSIPFIFSENRPEERKPILLTGRYGVGKSHATGVISHLLWDDFALIEDMLLRARNDMEETGSILTQFRENKKYFPVVLHGRDSGEVDDAKSFEFILEMGLERALKKYNYYDKINKENEITKYILWLESQKSDPRNKGILEDIDKIIKECSTFTSTDDLIQGLRNYNFNALETLKKCFLQWNVQGPKHLNAVGYYQNVLKDLKKIDPSIAGIIIYWDEFTTVFNTAGRYNDSNLINKIQNWAELASDSIYLFFISHLTPQALRGKYKFLDDALAKIDDRFKVINIRMDKITTYHLIAESLIIKDREEFKKYLKKLGYTSQMQHRLREMSNQIFGDLFSKDKELIERTIPLHFYSVYTAGKIADLIGSAERSIFQMLHSGENINTSYGTKLGFAKFLELEPSKDQMVWYTIDQIFDFFHKDLLENESDNFDNPNIVRALNAFRQYYPLAEQMGEGPTRVFKAIVLMEMLNALTGDPPLLPSKKNLENAYALTEIPNLDQILTLLLDKPLIIKYSDPQIGSVIFKTKYGGYDEEELLAIKKEIKTTVSFEEFIKRNQNIIIKKLIEGFSYAPRIFYNYASLTLYSAGIVSRNKQMIQDLQNKGSLSVIIALSETSEDIDNARKFFMEVSNEVKNTIFILYDQNYKNHYERWLEGSALLKLGENRSNRTIINEGQSQIDASIEQMTKEFSRSTIVFRGNSQAVGSNIGIEINKYIKEIYNRGFDNLAYKQFWESPKTASKDIMLLYGKNGARKQLEDHKTYYVRKIFELFKERDNILVDNKLLLKEDEQYVVTSGLFEIISKIRGYIKENNGKWLSLRSIIDSLALEEPPYGICGWLESLVMAYALAEYTNEARLEVMAGNQTPSKDLTLIVEAINNSIKNKNQTLKIRYGSAKENRLAQKLLEIFNIQQETKPSLPDVIFKIRETINSQFGLPIWAIPYSFKQKEKEKDSIQSMIDSVNQIIMQSESEKEFSEAHIGSILTQINEIELKYKKIWTRCFIPETVTTGFLEYVRLHYPRLMQSYPTPDELIIAVKSKIKEDPWTWPVQRVSEVLAQLNTCSVAPRQPQNLRVTYGAEGVILIWDIPEGDSIPVYYDIERGKSNDQFTLLTRITADTTRYQDSSSKPGSKYYYRIIAVNPVSSSVPSNIIEQNILPLPPRITLKLSPREDHIVLKWDTVDPQYEIIKFELYRGESASNLTLLETINSTEDIFQDYSIEMGKKYYYTIIAINSAEQRGSRSISPPCHLLPSSPPMSPSDLNCMVEKLGIRITWSFPADFKDFITEFCVYRKDSSGKIISVATTPPQQVTYLDNEIQPGMTYVYSASARNIIGESTLISASPIKILPLLPSIIVSIMEQNGKALLSWKKAGDEYGIIGYIIRRGEKRNKLEKLISLPPSVSEYIDDAVKMGHLYYYELIVQNSAGVSRNCEEIVQFSPSINIDINAWEDTTKIFIGSDANKFINKLYLMLNTVINDSKQSNLTEKDKEKVIKLKTFLETIK